MKRLEFMKENEAKKINQTAIEILEKVGIRVKSKKVRELLIDFGAKAENNSDIVKIPSSLTENSINSAPSKVIYGASNKENDLVLEDSKKVFSRPLTGAEGYIDIETGEYRLTKLKDVIEWVRLVDALENISYCSVPYPNDVRTDIRDIQLTQIMIENTKKHIEIQPYTGKNLEYIIEMALTAMGSEKELKKRPLITILTSSLAPMQYLEYSTDVLIMAGKYGIPVELTPMPIAGATGPVTVAGLVTITLAEALGGIVISQTANPGAPIVFRPNQLFLDMSTTVALQGAAENALIAALGTQIVKNYWKIPVNVFGTVTDSFIMDEQSITERVFNAITPALCGANIISGGGMLEHCYTVDPVQLVIDDDIFGMLFRIINGVTVNDDTIGLDAILRTKPGGNFLMDEHTLKYFKNEYFQPKSFYRKARATWNSEGKKTAGNTAKTRLKSILKNHWPTPIDNNTKKELSLIMSRASKEIK